MLTQQLQVSKLSPLNPKGHTTQSDSCLCELCLQSRICLVSAKTCSAFEIRNMTSNPWHLLPSGWRHGSHTGKKHQRLQITTSCSSGKWTVITKRPFLF